MIIVLVNDGGMWVVERCKLSHSNLNHELPKLIHVICNLKELIERRRVEECNHLLRGEGVKGTNRHQRKL